LADLILKNYFDPKRKNFRKKIKNLTTWKDRKKLLTLKIQNKVKSPL